MKIDKKLFLKIIILLVAFIVAIVILSFIYNKFKNNSKKGEGTFQIGETITLYNNNEIEFTLDSVEFTNYYNSNINDINFMTKSNASDSDKKKQADRKIFIIFSAKIKYVGKEETTFSGLGGFCTIDYNNGYTFKPQNVYVKKDTTWQNTVQENGSSTTYNFTKFEPLDTNEYLCKGYFEVPIELNENTNTPLFLNINQQQKSYLCKIR